MIRNRLASVAACLEDGCGEVAAVSDVQANPTEVTVFLDSAYVRSRPEYQRRNFEVVVGSIESETDKKRRFGLSQAGADHSIESLRSNMKAAGWREGIPVTVLSDGDPALPRLVRNAIYAAVYHALCWLHASGMWRRRSKACCHSLKATRPQELRRLLNACACAWGMVIQAERLMHLAACSDLQCGLANVRTV